ncbi:acetate--CoA ligase family protein [Pelotomaculum isophthalicicum]|uniref:acetate--CoA ligase family protein n=1 Tax=Pelotomaculum isophthalicicum TaxID=342448 RepID=UPI003B846248
MEQTEAFRLLESYGIPVVRWEKAKDIVEAVSLAEKIGYPVTIKVISPDIIHKSDVGGVRLNIGNPQQLLKRLLQKCTGRYIADKLAQKLMECLFRSICPRVQNC